MRQAYIKLLSEQPKQNFGNTNTKINIHFPVRGDLLNYCLKLNEQLRKVTWSGIDFSPASFQIPHLTLYMGFVRTESDYNNVLNTTYNFAKQIKRININVTKPYLKLPQKRYVFIDTKQSSEIISLKQEFKHRLDQWMEPLSWDVVAEIPHLTMGYVKGCHAEIEELLKTFEEGPDFITEAFEISFGGPWGSSIGTIRTFEIPIK
jgi:2'-5' RNA ligase